MPLPTVTARPAQGATAPAAAAQQAQPPIPFIRASRKKSALVGTITATPTTTQLSLAAQQIRPAGFLARIRLVVQGTTAGNAAAVAFAADAPWNILQQIGFVSPAGDTIMSTIDGFTLFALNRYGAFASGRRDPLADPTYSVTTGAGATGGSFKFMLDIPVEVDSRDAFCTLQNMAANQQFILQLSLNTLANIYTVAPTSAPSVTVTAVMEYYSAPNPTNGDGYPQQVTPSGNGSLSLIQIQTPSIVPSTTQNIQLVNVGNTIRFALFILRNASGVRTETDWPTVTNFYVNNDLYFYKNKDLWRSQMAIEYGATAGITAAPTLNALDAGVFVLTDFMNSGSAGGMEVNGASNRNQFLVTGSGTGFNIEAGTAWGAAASSLLAVENVIKPANPQSLYAPEIY
jgi:hypothetical protein